MRKKAIIGLILCLLLSTTSFASSVVSDGSLLEMDEFTLNLDAGMMYTINSKIKDTNYITVLPYSADGDYSSSIGFIWSTAAEVAVSTQIVDGSRIALRMQVTSELERMGLTVGHIEYDNSLDSSISGVPCIILDSDILMYTRSFPLQTYQRYIFVGEKEHMIIITGDDKNMLNNMTELLNTAVVWK